MEKKRKGMVVVVCAPSQRGKDFIIGKIMEELALCFEIHNLTENEEERSDKACFKYATVYKTRDKRENDPEHIHTISKVEDCPFPQDERIGYTIYGTQQVIYSEKEIERGINSGEVIFISTGEVDFAREIKKKFGNDCFSVMIQGYYKQKKDMIKEEVKRAGGRSNADIDKINNNVEMRIKDIELEVSKMQTFLQDKDLGPDMIIRNTYTIFNEEWCSQFKETTDNDVFWVAETITQAIRCNSNNGNFRDANIHLLTDEERQEININNLFDYYLKYRNNKIINEP